MKSLHFSHDFWCLPLLFSCFPSTQSLYILHNKNITSITRLWKEKRVAHLLNNRESSDTKGCIKINYSVVMLLSRMNETTADDAINDRERERSLDSNPFITHLSHLVWSSRSSPWKTPGRRKWKHREDCVWQSKRWEGREREKMREYSLSTARIWMTNFLKRNQREEEKKKRTKEKALIVNTVLLLLLFVAQNYTASPGLFSSPQIEGETR